jgi:hypothetical protein
MEETLAAFMDRKAREDAELMIRKAKAESADPIDYLMRINLSDLRREPNRKLLIAAHIRRMLK